jgi:hypothetical protein
MSGAIGSVEEDAGSDDIAGAAAAGAGVGAAAGAAVGAAAASEILTGSEAGKPEAEAGGPDQPAAPAGATPAAPGPPTDEPPSATPAAAAAASTGPADQMHVEVPAQPEVPTSSTAEFQAGAAASVPAPAGAPPGGGSDDDKSGGVPSWVIYGGILLIVLLVAGGAFLLTSGGDDGGETADPEVTAAPGTDGGTEDTTAQTSPPITEAVVVETVACDTSGGFEGCIEDVTVDDTNNSFIVEFATDFAAAEGSTHYHFFLNPPTGLDNGGINGSPPGSWMVHFSGSPAQVNQSNQTPSDARANGSTEMCMRVANADHSFVPGTGNCVSIAELL